MGCYNEATEDDTLSRPLSPSAHGTGCNCVPLITTAADRLRGLQQQLATEAEPMASLTQLLRLCRDEHPTLWEHHADPRCRSRVDALLHDVSETMPTSVSASALGEATRRAISDALTIDPSIPPVVVAHGLAELIDARFGHGFVEWFRARSPYKPAVGDPIPLDSPDLRDVTELPPTAPPWRLANRLDETRRVRLAGAWTTQFQLIFDYALFDALAGTIGRDTLIATCHPNRGLDELGLLTIDHDPTFPVGPVNVARQTVLVDALVSAAENAGAGIVVLPELSVTARMAEQLESWVRRPGPVRLLVAGSHHCADTTGAHRANRAVAWARGHPAAIMQDKHSPADRPVVEDITPGGWPELRIYVTSDGWHLVIVVCRDLLNPHAVHALNEAGANLVLAPSMSETLQPFGGPVAQLVGATQAIVAVANNPADWWGQEGTGAPHRPARALFGHPGFGQQTRQVHAPDGFAGVAFLEVGSGRLRWLSTESDAAPPADARSADVPAPEWADVLASFTAPPKAQRVDPQPYRPAAVLILLTAGRDGPKVLLTRRAPDLTHYAGKFVFPGGAADDGDADAAGTALREANEEIGLDPAGVRVLGTLPTLALADSGFLVTPVLAWASQLRLVHGSNPAEVTELRTVPLMISRPTGPEDPGVTGASRGDDGIAPDQIGVVTRALLDQLTAYLQAGRAARHQPVPG